MRMIIAICALLFSVLAAAQLTSAQRTTLLTNINSDSTRAGQLASGQDQALADYYNTAGTFDCWRDRVELAETGAVFIGTEFAGMSSANHTRLQTMAQYYETSYDPSRTDIRAMFNDIWSGAGGVNTRAALLVLWKTKCTNLQKLLAADPDADNVWNSQISAGTAGYRITPQEISSLR